MILLFLKLLNVLALQVRKIRTDFMCDLTDTHSVYVGNISVLLKRRQHFGTSQATESASRRIATAYACMRAVYYRYCQSLFA